MGAFGGRGVAAGDWTILPSVSVSETYTDNAQLAPRDEQGDLISSVIPGIAIRGTGRRVKTNADYQYQYNKFLERSELDSGTHLLQGSVDTEVVREHLFVDVNAAMFPSLRTNTGQISNRTRTRQGRQDQLNRGNSANVISYGITPRYQHALGSFADFTASTNISDTTTGDSATAGGGTNSNLRMGLNSGRRFARADWGLNFSRRTNETENGEQDSTFQTLFWDVGYRLNRFFRLTGSIGIEDNEFSTDQGQQSGPSWRVGGVWTPSPRTKIGGTYGQRSFGETKQFDFSYRLRRITLSGNYNEELRTSSELLNEQQIFVREDVFGNPIPPSAIDNTEIGLPIDSLSLTDDVFIQRRLNANIGYFRKRDSFSVNVYRNEQESTRNEQAESVVGMRGNWNHRWSPRASTGLSIDHQVRESDGINGETIFTSLQPYLTYSIGPNLSSRISYSYTDSASDFPDSSFTENSVTGSLSYTF